MLTHYLTQRGKHAQKGQGLVEYAIILCLVAIVSIVVLALVSGAVSRNFGVIGGALGAKKNAANAASATGAGVTNTIYIDTSYVITCEVDQSSTIGTYVRVQFYASSDISLTDIAYSLDSTLVQAGANTTGSSPYLAKALVKNVANAALCPKTVVITAKKAIAIMPVTATQIVP